MRIESGPTNERRIRLSIFVVMCAAFAGWFTYDGFVGYPKKNLEWARGNIPGQPDDLTFNPEATLNNLEGIAVGMPVEEVRDVLGAPALRQPPMMVFHGPSLTVEVVQNDDGTVKEVRTLDPQNPKHDSNLVTKDRAGRISPGMSPVEVSAELGRAAETRPETWWYIGVATYATFEIKADTVAKVAAVVENEQTSELDILIQKIIAGALAGVTLWTIGFLSAVMRTRAVLDDQGLMYKGRMIGWDDMVALEERLCAQVFGHPGSHEGSAAFVAKRKANFQER